MFRTVMLTCLLLLAGTLAYYGTNEAITPADFSFVNHGQVYTLDPQQTSWNSDIRICINVWEGLTTFDPITLQPAAGMAYFPPDVSNDGTVYTFHLRTDSHWSNGDPVTAHDFVRGWRRAVEPGTAGDFAYLIPATIRGAKEYYVWRSLAVELLGKLKSLVHHQPMTSEEIDQVFSQLRAAGLSLRGASISENVSYHGTPRALKPAALYNWHELRREYLRKHAAAMQSTWADVGIKALDDQTLRVTLIRPIPYFLELTSMSFLMPIHKSVELLRECDTELGIDENGLVTYDTQWTKPDYHRKGYPGLISNGIYRITNWRFRRRLRLQVNPYHYFREQAASKTLDIMMYENDNTAFQAYETGVVDWITVLNVDYVAELLKKRKTGERPDIKLTPAFGTYFYFLNCADEILPDGRLNPFVDVRVRKAFSLSVDRETFCRTVADKENPPMNTLIPAGSITGYPPLLGHPYDPELANRLLDEAGYQDRSTFPAVTILYSTGSDHERKAEALANMWGETLGVRVLLQGKETKTFGEDTRQHNFQIARGGWYGDYFDPINFLEGFVTDNGFNDSGFSNQKYDSLMQQAAQCSDPIMRMQILAQAETLLVTEEFPLIPLYRYTNPQAYRSYVKGIYPNSREIYSWRFIKVQR